MLCWQKDLTPLEYDVICGMETLLLVIGTKRCSYIELENIYCTFVPRDLSPLTVALVQQSWLPNN